MIAFHIQSVSDKKGLLSGVWLSLVGACIGWHSGAFAGSLDSARSQYSSDLSSTARASNAQNQILRKQYEQGLADHLSKGTPIPSQIIDKMRDNDRQFQSSRTQIDNSFTRKNAEAKNELKKEIATKLLGKPLPPAKKLTAAERKEEQKAKAEMRKKSKKMSKKDAKALKKAVMAGVGLPPSGAAVTADGKSSDKDRSPAGAGGGRPGYINTSGPARDTIVIDGSGVPKEIEFPGPAAKPVQSH